MIKSLLFIFLLFIPSLFFGQGHLNRKKKFIKKSFSLYRTIISETENSLTILIRDSLFKQEDYFYEFGKNGRCIKSIYKGKCDTCFLTFLQILEDPKFKWFQVDESTFYTSALWAIKLEIDKENDFTIILSLVNYSANKYEALKAQSALYKAINKL